MPYLGFIFALIAMLGWAFGDFFIQRASRKAGIVQTLFFNTLTLSVVLLPFVYRDLPALFRETQILWVLIGSGVVVFFTAVWQYYALEVGKLSVVEPVISLELPFTVLLTAAIGAEILPVSLYLIIAVVFLGIILSVSPSVFHLGKLFRRFEKGTFIALGGAIGMAVTNYLMGHGSQISSPMVGMWVIHVVITLLCVFYLLVTKRLWHLREDFNKAPAAIIGESILDNGAWLAYAFAVIYIPISVAITVSEGYIILAVLLGVVINREKLKHHQYFGVILAIGGVLLLSALSI